jgi:hypothetical protein
MKTRSRFEKGGKREEETIGKREKNKLRYYGFPAGHI